MTRAHAQREFRQFFDGVLTGRSCGPATLCGNCQPRAPPRRSAGDGDRPFESACCRGIPDHRNPARCQLTTVSGFTMTSTRAHLDHRRRRFIQNRRSHGLNLGRGFWRLRTPTCCRIVGTFAVESSHRKHGLYRVAYRRRIGSWRRNVGVLPVTRTLVPLCTLAERLMSSESSHRRHGLYRVAYSGRIGSWRRNVAALPVTRTLVRLCTLAERPILAEGLRTADSCNPVGYASKA
jgi:hypothetical protein